MEWELILNKIAAAGQNWEIIKTDCGHDKETRLFLKSSYLVLSNSLSQAPVSGFERMLRDGEILKYNFLNQTVSNQSFIQIVQRLEELRNMLKNLKSSPQHKIEINDQIRILKNKLDGYDLTQLEFNDDINVEIRFPGLKMDIIQDLKKLQLIDAEKTSMSSASIRVAIKTVPGSKQ